MIEVLPFFLILTLMILETIMNLFKNISIFRDQLCNCLPWGKDTKEEGPWQPRLDYRERNDDPELKPTPFPNKYQYDTDYKYLLEENERLEQLVKCLVLQMNKKESPLLDRVESLLTEKEIQKMALSNDVDTRPDTATIFPRITL